MKENQKHTSKTHQLDPKTHHSLNEKSKKLLEIFLERVCLYLLDEKLELNQENIELGFRAILERDKYLFKQKQVISKILAPIIWGVINKKEIDKRAEKEINFNLV